jgi:uncharacterized membrane protein
MRSTYSVLHNIKFIMISKAAFLYAICTCVSKVYSQDQKSNLPIVPEGFNASAKIEINAPVEKVWAAIVDFPSYPKWNPFVRYFFSLKLLNTPTAD